MVLLKELGSRNQLCDHRNSNEHWVAGVGNSVDSRTQQAQRAGKLGQS